MSISTQLAEFKKWEKTTVGAQNTPAVNVLYKRLDGDAPKDMTVRFLTGKLPEASQKVLKELKEGDKFVVVKEKSGEYWNLKEFQAASEWKEKPAYTPNKQWAGKSGGSYTKPAYDDTGVKVGAARNQALAYLAATWKGQESFTLDDVDKTAYEIVQRQAAMEANVRAGVSVAPTTEEHFTNDNQDEDIPF